MEISHIEMDHISEQSNRQQVLALESFAPNSKDSTAGNAKNNQGDVYQADSGRQYLRELCEIGEAESHVGEIINSSIEPDCLRAELAFRYDSGDKAAISIIINYLAGNFNIAMQKTQQLADYDKMSKLEQFVFFSDYFSGNFEPASEEAKNLNELINYSPLFCYAYADILLSLGYIDEARTYTKKYVMLARKYLKNFVSEKEKYDQNRNRREQNSRRGKQESGDGFSSNTHQNKSKTTDEAGNPLSEISQGDSIFEHSATLLELLGRRKFLRETIGTRNVSFDKRPMMFELDDIDARIAQLSGRHPQ
jgi:hypothetical protein